MNTIAAHQLARTAVLFMAAFMGSTADAQTRPSRTEPDNHAESILWIGNRFFYYNNGMHNHFGQLVSAAGGRVRSTSVTISGAAHDAQQAAMRIVQSPAATGRPGPGPWRCCRPRSTLGY